MSQCRFSLLLPYLILSKHFLYLLPFPWISRLFYFISVWIWLRLLHELQIFDLGIDSKSAQCEGDIQGLILYRVFLMSRFKALLFVTNFMGFFLFFIRVMLQVHCRLFCLLLLNNILCVSFLHHQRLNFLSHSPCFQRLLFFPDLLFNFCLVFSTDLVLIRII